MGKSEKFMKNCGLCGTRGWLMMRTIFQKIKLIKHFKMTLKIVMICWHFKGVLDRLLCLHAKRDERRASTYHRGRGHCFRQLENIQIRRHYTTSDRCAPFLRDHQQVLHNLNFGTSHPKGRRWTKRKTRNRKKTPKIVFSLTSKNFLGRW